MEEIKMMESTSGITISEFAERPITSLFWKYALLGLAGLLLQTASVIADGIFVGQGIGGLGLATIGIIAPLWTINVAFFNLFGMGASAVATIRRGNGNAEGARQVYGTIVIFSFLFSAVISLLALLNLEGILTFLGATEEILPVATEYAVPYLIGSPLCVAGTVAYFFARADEQPWASAIGYMAPAVVAIILEYIMIYKWEMGMAGAAIPWVVCVGGSFLLVPFMQVKGKAFRISASDFKIDLSIVFQTLKVGSAFFAVPLCATLATILINNLIIRNGGSELEIAAFGIINAYIAYIIMIINTALVSGMQPIASYNMGAGNFSRVAQVLKVSSIQITVVMVIAVALAVVFAEQATAVFIGPDPVIIEATAAVIRVYLLFYAVGNISQVAAAYFQAVERSFMALFNGVTKVLIFAVPFLMLLPQFFGIKGIWMAQPIADIISGILAMFFLYKEYKKLKRMDTSILEQGKLR